MTALAAISLGWAQVLIPSAANLSRMATGNLVAAVWQGILLAVAVALGLRLLPKTPPAVRFAIWFAVFAVVTALPMLPLWQHTAVATGSTGRVWLTLDARWSLAIAMIWLAASLGRGVTLIVAAMRLRSLWKRATPVEASVANAATGSRQAQLCASDEVDRPAVIGFFSPKILIPSWLLDKLSAEELQQIVLHETGHLGRADDWMNLLQKIALVIFPLNPALAWVERRLCFERELAVDDRVLRALEGKAGAATAYAACLATLAEYRLQRRGFALTLGALGRESELGRRVGRILRRAEPMRPMHARLVLGGAMLGLLVAAVSLERVPLLVGFAPVSHETGATAAITPIHPVQPHRYSYQPVVMRMPTSPNRMLQRRANVQHEVLLKAPSNTRGTVVAAADIGAERLAVHLDDQGGQDVRETLASVEPTPIQSPAATAAVQPASVGSNTGVVEWVVVTSWQSTDGAHMVLTTASEQGSQGKALSTPVVSRQWQPSDQFHPYAAVPVRGGWLIFQL